MAKRSTLGFDALMKLIFL